ncbi:ergosterol biosynthetic protein 28 homolog isoform X1 [Moschus berezovskii]|uniref:ergosterol biosynthetic protein 28 homolog isoform X1 n=1 Tax=Moschus berezovskii TaxID=68408 RepID=UPI0024452374|nr:ergosterol biosynthetic protein 28 homolog isoform X1 [Moschus berezovskii]XP_055291667.1 ergosterol biosynthetic protein 28 homolog isoform X1 [Moschus berezovskii]
MSRFLNVLRSWLMMTSIIALGNSLQSFRDHTFLYEKLYTVKPDLVNGLQARTFGIWTLLSSVIRCFCAINIHNKTYLNPGHASGAPAPGSRTRIQTEEEKLRPAGPVHDVTSRLCSPPPSLCASVSFLLRHPLMPFTFGAFFFN